MKLSVNVLDSSNTKWVSLILLVCSICVLQVDSKPASAQEIRIANVDHDIDDIIDGKKTKYRPSERQPESRREAEVPKPKPRSQTQSNERNSQQNSQSHRKRK